MKSRNKINFKWAKNISLLTRGLATLSMFYFSISSIKESILYWEGNLTACVTFITLGVFFQAMTVTFGIQFVHALKAKSIYELP